MVLNSLAPPLRSKRGLSPEKIAAIKRLYTRGYNQKQITRKLHLSEPTVVKYLKGYKIYPGPWTKARKILILFKSGLSSDEIAARVNSSVNSVIVTISKLKQDGKL